jgi:hypothetical protein
MKNIAGSRHSLHTTRTLTILAQDPSVRAGGRMIRAAIEVPAEQLLPGPSGYRVSVVDYDASGNVLHTPLRLEPGLEGEDVDPYADPKLSDKELLGDPGFHQQNVYAIVMRILARFEFALGRRVPWGSKGHQLHVVPHAFAEPNAFYSRDDRALFFGYFAVENEDGSVGPTVFTCLSHDVIAHETTHALIDGLRSRYLEPSTPDPGGFHEGFSDVVALLSVFALEEVVGAVLDGKPGDTLIAERALKRERLVDTALLGLADEMGQALSGIRGEALRRSAKLPPSRDYINDPEFDEEHVRGELLVAPMLRSFLDIWLRRMEKIGTFGRGKKDRSLVVEEGARAADHLLTIAIRALDYCPPVEISFSDYLSALLTIDREVVPDDRYGYRQKLLDNFDSYGITPAPADSATGMRNVDADGTWLRWNRPLVYSRTHFDSMLRDEEEMFRFVWENRGEDALNLDEEGYIEVQSVRPSTRIAPDGFVLRETVAEYVQILTLAAEELRDNFRIAVPDGLEDWREVMIFGGGTLIFDEYGQLKYHIAKHLYSTEEARQRQARRLQYLWDIGFFEHRADPAARLSDLHLARAGLVERRS